MSLYWQLGDDGMGGFSSAAAASETCLSRWLERGCIISPRCSERGPQMPDEIFRGGARRQQSHIGVKKQSDGGVKENGMSVELKVQCGKKFSIIH